MEVSFRARVLLWSGVGATGKEGEQGSSTHSKELDTSVLETLTDEKQPFGME